MKILRPYQFDARACVHEAFKTYRSVLLQLATGLGKTKTAAELIKDFQPGRTLFVADTDELIEQAVEAITDWTGLDVQIEKASQYASTNLLSRMPVVVSSIQTQCSGKPGARRYLRFRPEEFDLLIIDECHKSASKTWTEMIAYFMQNPKLKVVGLSATPERHDKKKLGFEWLAYKMDILKGSNEGWLVPIVQHYVPVSGLDFSHIRTVKGDLHEGELAKVMELEKNIYGICQPTLEVMYGLEPKHLSQFDPPQWHDYLLSLNRKPRPTLIYTVSVAQAEHCCNVFRRAVDGVEWICGKTNKDDRKSIVSAFKAGELSALVNVGCLTHGFDAPIVEIICQGRPTKSKSLVEQIIGRGTRPLPGIVDGLVTAEERLAAIKASAKPYIRVLDFVGNSGEHKLCSTADVLGGSFSPEVIELAKLTAMTAKNPKLILSTLQNADQELERRKRLEAERQRQAEEAHRKHLLAKVNFTMQEVDSFGGPIIRNGKPAQSADGRTFTEWQAKTLREGGIDPRSVKYWNGCGIINKLRIKPTPKQIKTLEERHVEWRGKTRKECTKLIDAIAIKEGWGKRDAFAGKAWP